MDRVFFTNSGAEAVEGAIKAARKYAYLRMAEQTMRLLPWSIPSTDGPWEPFL